jgi:hypothetical protein
MQSSQWIALLKKIPVEVHNQLSVVTLGGTEVVVQSIQLLEGECLVFKGRLAASQDTGRLFFVPYDQIDYIGFVRSVGEDEVRTWFGDGGTSATNRTEKPEQANGSHKTPPNRAALLERVRSRSTSPGHGSSTPTAGS